MLKSIEKSNISRRSFQVFKDFTITDAEINVVSASFESGLFDSGSSSFISSSVQDKLFTHPLYESIKAKYYINDGNPFTLFGATNNIGLIGRERNIGSTIRVISIPQSKYGERIKPGSVTLTDNTNGVTFTDNSVGSFRSGNPTYTLVSVNFASGVIEIQDTDGDIFVGTITSFNFATGLATITFSGDTETFTIVKLDLANSVIETAVSLSTLFEGVGIDETLVGNIFYSDGLIVFNNVTAFHEYELSYKSTRTIYETEVFVNAKAGEFNYSQNPSAVEVQISGSYNFTTTNIFNDEPAGTKKITEIKDIKRREFYSGSFLQSISGSWEDYHTSGSIDPTGSYLAPYITTIGLYDKTGEMVAVAKLPKPIKNLPDYDVNFIVRLDT
tara:strand:+ start:16298 stop:17455 length:1158 start_codon:yes stop_codon:yes gene_type:complete